MRWIWTVRGVLYLVGSLGVLQAVPRGAQPSLAVLPALHRPLYVTVVYQGKCSHCMRIGVAVPISGTVARLREAVSLETKIPLEQVRPGLLTCLPSLQWEGQGRLLSLVAYVGIKICCPRLNREAR